MGSKQKRDGTRQKRDGLTVDDFLDIYGEINREIAKAVFSEAYTTNPDTETTQFNFAWKGRQHVIALSSKDKTFNWGGMDGNYGRALWIWYHRFGQLWQLDLEEHVRDCLENSAARLERHILLRQSALLLDDETVFAGDPP